MKRRILFCFIYYLLIYFLSKQKISYVLAAFFPYSLENKMPPNKDCHPCMKPLALLFAKQEAYLNIAWFVTVLRSRILLSRRVSWFTTANSVDCNCTGTHFFSQCRQGWDWKMPRQLEADVSMETQVLRWFHIWISTSLSQLHNAWCLTERNTGARIYHRQGRAVRTV